MNSGYFRGRPTFRVEISGGESNSNGNRAGKGFLGLS